MSSIQCHRCGRPLADGSPKFQVDVRVRSVFDGVIPEPTESDGDKELNRILDELADKSEEELNRQIYEDDVFIMCPLCKEAFLEEIYSRLHPKAAPEGGRAHLIN